MKVNKEQIIKTFVVINTFFPHHKYEITEELVNGWLSFFSHYDPTLFQEAIRNAIASSQFVPTIATIIAEAKKIMGKSIPLPEDAWMKLREASVLKSYKYTSSQTYEWDYSECYREAQKLPKIAIDALEAVGGWPAIVNLDDKDFVFNRFIKTYRERAEDALERAVKSQTPLFGEVVVPKVTGGEVPISEATTLARKWTSGGRK